MKQYLSLTTSIVALSLLAIQPALAQRASASSTFEGTTTTVTENTDGSTTVTRTDKDGHTTTTVRQKPRPGQIMVGDGKGGWKVYNPPAKPLAGTTGISVGDGNGGWKPYNPPPKPPAGPTGISVGDGKGGWRPYFPGRG
jgi:hypothetical protein